MSAGMHGRQLHSSVRAQKHHLTIPIFSVFKARLKIVCLGYRKKKNKVDCEHETVCSI
jgi:hypothetical protein